MPACYCFDVDDCLEIGGQVRLPSTFGPVTIASIRAQVAQGDMAGVVGNWMNLPSVLPDWREVFSFLLPPTISSSPKAFWLAWVRNQYPGYDRYVCVGNDPRHHDLRPAYWDRDYPGSLPVTHVPGDSLLSNDYAAASQAGFEFIKEDAWAAGQRTGKVPPPIPQDPFYVFPKGVRLPMHYKTFHAPEILKADDALGIIEAIVSVTGNKDHQGDIIDPGAWKPALDSAEKSGRMPKITVDHRWSVQNNLGRTLSAEEWLPGDPRLPDSLKSKGLGGLWVKGQFNLDKQLSREVYSDLKGGYVTEFSVGFDIASDTDGKKCEGDADDGFHIKGIDPLYEWSPVFLGANPETSTYAVKSLAPDPAEVFTEADFDALDDDAKLAAYYQTLDIPDEALATADRRDTWRKDLILLAKWSRAFINKLPDSAFAMVLPGGTKDATGRTAPRSLRKLPHHGTGGAVDKPHLSNALSRAAQQPALKKAIPHLRKHANAIGMGKSDDDHEPANVSAPVTEQTLITLGAAVGQSVASALKAKRPQPM